MLVPQSQEPALPFGLIALLVLAVGVGFGRRVREFLSLVRDASYDEWRWPR